MASFLERSIGHKDVEGNDRTHIPSPPSNTCSVVPEETKLDCEDDEDVPLDLTGRTGSLRYMAPEVAASRPYNEKAEVYSWAIIFWEMAVGEKPYMCYNADAFQEMVVQRHIRPNIDRCRTWPFQLRDLVTRCWDPSISNRPTFAYIVKYLNQIERDCFDGDVLSWEPPQQSCGCTIC